MSAVMYLRISRNLIVVYDNSRGDGWCVAAFGVRNHVYSDMSRYSCVVRLLLQRIPVYGRSGPNELCQV